MSSRIHTISPNGDYITTESDIAYLKKNDITRKIMQHNWGSCYHFLDKGRKLTIYDPSTTLLSRLNSRTLKVEEQKLYPYLRASIVKPTDTGFLFIYQENLGFREPWTTTHINTSTLDVKTSNINPSGSAHIERFRQMSLNCTLAAGKIEGNNFWVITSDNILTNFNFQNGKHSYYPWEKYIVTNRNTISSISDKYLTTITSNKQLEVYNINNLTKERPQEKPIFTIPSPHPGLYSELLKDKLIVLSEIDAKSSNDTYMTCTEYDILTKESKVLLEPFKVTNPIDVKLLKDITKSTIYLAHDNVNTLTQLTSKWQNRKHTTISI